jgi:transcriptional regulator with XRE-family HTH domain
MTNPRKPSAEDRQHGRELSRRRKALGLSQGEVAVFLGISTQQYGKYERGENRMSVARFEVIERFLSQKEGNADGLQEAPQAAFQPPVSKATAQKHYDRIVKGMREIEADLAIVQRFLDQN